MIKMGLMKCFLQFPSIENTNGIMNEHLYNVCFVTLHTLAMQDVIIIHTQNQLAPKLLSWIAASETEVSFVKYEYEKISVLSISERTGRPSNLRSIHCYSIASIIL